MQTAQIYVNCAVLENTLLCSWIYHPQPYSLYIFSLFHLHPFLNTSQSDKLQCSDFIFISKLSSFCFSHKVACPHCTSIKSFLTALVPLFLFSFDVNRNQSADLTGLCMISLICSVTQGSIKLPCCWRVSGM